jgi:hypothetical protein
MDQLHERIRQLEDRNREIEADKKKAEDDKKKAEDGQMEMVKIICTQSPWRHLQFERGTFGVESVASSALSPSRTKSPGLNKNKRKDFRTTCSRISQITKIEISDFLKCAHIVPRKTAEASFVQWGLDSELTTDSQKNLLLLYDAVEVMYDQGHFCLVMRPVPGTDREALSVEILNGSIREDTIRGTQLKYKDLEGTFLDTRLLVPSHRCIAKHSYYSLAAAAYKGWIGMPEYSSLVAQIKENSPEQDKIAWVQSWLRSQSGPGLFAAPLSVCPCLTPCLRCTGGAAAPAKRSLDPFLAACSSAGAAYASPGPDASKRCRTHSPPPRASGEDDSAGSTTPIAGSGAEGGAGLGGGSV